MTQSKQTWLITGCSSGLGEAIAHVALRRGDNVIATARNGVQRLQTLKESGATILSLDVQAPQVELDTIVQEALRIYGGIDVLVNNAAYIEASMLEELSHERLLSAYNTNFFGAINLTRSLLPHFRSKRSGSIVYMGSMSAYVGEFAAISYISAKGALDSGWTHDPLPSQKANIIFSTKGFIDCVSKEVSPFNIKCMLAIFGEYRTNIISERNVAWAPNKIDEYTTINNAVRYGLKKADHAQPGDPNKAAERLIDGVKGQGDAKGRAMPSRLVIGADAFKAIRSKCQMMLKVCDDWEAFGTNTDYDGVVGAGFLGSVS